jgi:hypothetical protein
MSRNRESFQLARLPYRSIVLNTIEGNLQFMVLLPVFRRSEDMWAHAIVGAVPDVAQPYIDGVKRFEKTITELLAEH